MQFDNKTTRSVADAVEHIMSEALKGNQHKIDANKNDKIDAHDFELLRKKKKVEEETVESKKKEDPPFDADPVKKKPSAVAGKFGMGYSTAKHLAQQGMKKAMKKEETELTESHFKVGDEVICKDSGMEGEVIKLDKEHGAEDEKYYTVKREDGKTIKYAPNELKKSDEDEDEEDEKEEMKEATKPQENKFHSKLDKLVHSTFGKRKEEMKESEKLDEYDAKQGVYRHKGTYGSAKGAEFGATDYKKENELAKAADKEKKAPARKAYGARQNFVRSYAKESFSALLDVYNKGGIKSLQEALLEEEPDNEQFTKEVERQKRKGSGTAPESEKAKVAAAAVKAVKVVEDVQDIHVISVDKANGVEMIDIEERSLTEPEMKKKEEIVKSMKKNLTGFKSRYGDDAKSVMYATATKIAKKD